MGQVLVENLGCEGETDLTTQLRERKDLIVSFLSGQLQQELNKVKFVLKPAMAVWSMEHTQHGLAQLAAMESAADMKEVGEKVIIAVNTWKSLVLFAKRHTTT